MAGGWFHRLMGAGRPRKALLLMVSVHWDGQLHRQHANAPSLSAPRVLHEFKSLTAGWQYTQSPDPPTTRVWRPPIHPLIADAAPRTCPCVNAMLPCRLLGAIMPSLPVGIAIGVTILISFELLAGERAAGGSPARQPSPLLGWRHTACVQLLMLPLPLISQRAARPVRRAGAFPALPCPRLYYITRQDPSAVEAGLLPQPPRARLPSRRAQRAARPALNLPAGAGSGRLRTCAGCRLCHRRRAGRRGGRGVTGVPAVPQRGVDCLF
jgi:hypothetical protein